ncbi:asparagine synthase-domain-containing protein [Syncephalis plumigaleata]|nr:asparagine synthase-domain-containing protein [Syncephalis plumigaleata]
MCGIVFALQVGTISSIEKQPCSVVLKEWQPLVEANRRRGPDATGYCQCRLDSGVNEDAASTDRMIDMYFEGATLHLRGPQPTQQPLKDQHGNILCWNGEVFAGLEIGHRNDGLCLLEALDAAASPLDVLHRIRGPFGFIYYQAKQRRLWFGRDCLGRRSLLWRYYRQDDIDRLVIASVGLEPTNNEEEMRDNTTNNDAMPLPMEYATEVPAMGIFSLDLPRLLDGNDTIPHSMKMTRWISPELVETSTDDYLPLPFGRLNKAIPAADEDLLPIHEELLPWDDPNYVSLLKAPQQKLLQLLSNAVQCRVIDIPGHSKKQSRLGILFSGGLDCMCLAALADRHLPAGEPVDLINVAFENPRTLNINNTATAYEVPDRKTGRCGLAELQRLAPNRPWQFVEVNVPYADACAAKSHIMQLMAPATTLMDMSIAMALWFAAGGKGSRTTANLDGPESYDSQCPVLLSGLGADELFAGYTRHREAWRRGGWSSLIDEVQLDIDRISSRNLGRDDRIISDRAREVRFPFLDENVVSYACELPIHVKTDPRLPRGVGEKMLLRAMAACELNLKDTSTRWKRAIQFGARTAKMESGKERGTHRAI